MSRTRPSWLRRLRRMALYLLLGLVTTVGVAWSIAAILRAPGGARMLNMGTADGWRDGDRVHYSGFGIKVVRHWDAHQSGGLGFPLRSMSFSRDAGWAGPRCPLKRSPTSLYLNGIDLPTIGNSSDWGDPPLALRPLWAGLAIDTALYGVFWWLSVVVLYGFRAEHRRRRCLCPVCGYNLKPDYTRGCSECGWLR